MTNSNRNFVKILKEICKKHNIQINSYGSDWVFELKKNNKCFYIVGYEFPDVSSSKKICDDKSSLSEILTKHKISNVEHVYFMNPKDIFYIDEINWQQRLIKTFNKFNQNVVVKPNSGTSGEDVYHINTRKDLIDKINLLFEKNKHVAVCPYFDIDHEFRVVVYRHKSQLIFDKKRTSSWKHNLASGSIPMVVSKSSLCSKISNIALVATKLLNINFASVDIIQVKNKLFILEINSGVMLEKFSSFSKENYDIAKAIYEKVIKNLLIL